MNYGTNIVVTPLLVLLLLLLLLLLLSVSDKTFVKVVVCFFLSLILIGLSDPFVKVVVGKSKKKTKVVRKSLNPTYREHFELYVFLAVVVVAVRMAQVDLLICFLL